jgi:SAM-dependent methyltransferase
MRRKGHPPVPAILCLFAASLIACAEPPPVVLPAPPACSLAAPAVGVTVAKIREEAAALAPLVKTELVKEFLAAAAELLPQAPRLLWHDGAKAHFYTDAEAARLDEASRRALYAQTVDEELYYVDRFGTPVAYARPLEILDLGKDGLAGKRVLDFGFGAPGHLRMFAALGAHVTGIEVDPLSKALYTAPRDQGTMHGRLGRDGDLRLLYGAFPADAALKAAVGGGYDLFVSKNVLKRGYIHPERFAVEKHLISLGVDDETFVRTLHGMMAPGGRVLIYNLAPPQAPLDKPYIPWADGRCPFAKELWEKVGFHVVAFDRDDTAEARLMAKTLGWEEPEDFFGTYTLVERPAG